MKVMPIRCPFGSSLWMAREVMFGTYGFGPAAPKNAWGYGAPSMLPSNSTLPVPGVASYGFAMNVVVKVPEIGATPLLHSSSGGGGVNGWKGGTSGAGNASASRSSSS